MSELAIFGGPKTRTKPYPQWPVWDERDIEAVTQVIKSGRWGGYPYPGPVTAEFARKFAAMQGGGHAVPMANGTVTMEVALRASGIGWGDEVIVPAYTFQATAAAPMAAGAIPVIVDVLPESYCMDPAAAEKAITPRTRAIIPVHLGSNMADMDAIMALADKYNLVVIEDCAHAHGARWNQRGAGTIGHFGSFSLQSSKTLTAGEGGVLLCRTEELARKVMSVIDCGRGHEGIGGSEEGESPLMGANYRMTELQSALALVGLERFPEQARQREEMAAYMDESLSEVPGVRVLRRDARHTTRSFYRYIFALDPAVFGAEHEVVCAALEAEGVGCWVGYEAMHHYELFQPLKSKLAVPNAFPERFAFGEMSLPVAEQACEHEAVWLDESVFRDGPGGVDDAVSALKKIQQHAGELRGLSKK
ncbi:MAG TPA: DegT/DnrJ/EryC1/StrS family aminotransferase [Anaerolineaceae bacterium]|nr:DegT/DnrJ/EryC1/StrS family aminotransferase [Anaerolineaceae bacterium]